MQPPFWPLLQGPPRGGVVRWLSLVTGFLTEPLSSRVPSVVACTFCGWLVFMVCIFVTPASWGHLVLS